MNSRYLTAIVFLLLVSDNPSERPYMGLTSTALLSLGEIFYRSIGKTIGFNEIKIFPIEIFIVLAFYFLSEKKQTRLYEAAKKLLFCIAFLTLLGAVTGGSIRFAALQIRPLICLIYFALFFQQITNPSLLKRLEKVILYSCIIRCIFGIYLWLRIFRNVELFDHSMGDGSYIMSHSDSPLCVAAMCILIARAFHERHISFQTATFAVLILIFCTLNNRRIFFVELTASASALLYSLNFMSRVTNKHKVLATISGIIYSIWAWGSKSTLAYPIQTIKSSIMQSDASSMTRGVENYNLIYTIRQNPLFGQGFGHKYIEKVQAYDISHHFDAYEYVPHNSILWILTSGGVLFATFFYNFFSISIWMKISDDNTLRIICLPIVATYFLHCFGDMGAQCWKSAVLIGIIIGVSNASTEN